MICCAHTDYVGRVFTIIIFKDSYPVLLEIKLDMNAIFIFSALDEFLTCNIDKRPASAFVVSKEKSDEIVKKYAAMLKAADINDLIKGDIVWSGTESLQDYSETVEMYVGEYGKHFKALAGPRDIATN